MGILDDFKSVKDVQKLMKGKSVKLSLSQIVFINISLVDAYRNLGEKKYKEIANLYDEFRKCKTKILMTTRTDYYKTCADIIKEFDKIAPFESYSGLNPREASLLMKNIREMDNKTKESKNPRKEFVCKQTPEYDEWLKKTSINKGTETCMKDVFIHKEESNSFSEMEKAAIKEMLQLAGNSGLKVDEEDAKEFIKVVRVYNKNGKEAALEEFENLKKKIKEKYGILKSVLTVPFLIGSLSSCGIISKEESKEMSLNYSKEIMKDHNESKTLNVEVKFWNKIIEKLREKGMPAVASALTGTHGYILNDSTLGISGVDAFKKMIIEKPENIEAIKELVAIECKKDMQIEFMDKKEK